MGTEGFIKNAPYSNPQLHNDYYTYNYNVPAGLVSNLQGDPAHISTMARPMTGESLTFKTVQEGISLRPLYDIHRQRYVVYWNVTPIGK
jgi:hypothetical protein